MYTPLRCSRERAAAVCVLFSLILVVCVFRVCRAIMCTYLLSIASGFPKTTTTFFFSSRSCVETVGVVERQKLKKNISLRF